MDYLYKGEPMTASPITNGQMYELAKEYMLHRFASGWDVDSSLLSEYLAENSHIYANLTDEDAMALALSNFRKELDRLVRVAMADFQAMEELTATAARIGERQAA